MTRRNRAMVTGASSGIGKAIAEQLAAATAMVERGGGGGILNADEVAAAGMKGIDQNRASAVPGAMNKVGAGILTAIPAALRRVIVPRFAR